MYHISKDGKPRECNVTVESCKLEHYESAEEAQVVIDKRNENEYGVLPFKSH